MQMFLNIFISIKSIKSCYAASKIHAMQIRAMRNRASRGMTVDYILKVKTTGNQFQFFLGQ